MLAGQIIELIEKVAPLSWQESWDNSGLQIGQRDQQVTSALLCTDVTEAIVAEALEKGCEMIISHHPLLFHGLRCIDGTTMQQRCVIEAIKHNLVIYSSHTAMDSFVDGVSGYMAKKLGMTNYYLLTADALGTHGLGVIGELSEPMSNDEFLQLLADTFSVASIRYVPKRNEDEALSKVALCGGAGSEFLETAIKQGADAFVSADFKYHDLQQAEGRVAVFDIGHFESEHFTKEIFRDILKDYIRCELAESDVNPISVFVNKKML